RPDLSEDEFYAADLIGLKAITSAGQALGRVTSLDDYGAGPLLEIALDAGGVPLIVPFTKQVVPVIDMDGSQITVDPPPGYLDPPKQAGDTP
ncbi:MAG: ribosome maturation factor RimM, partial [Pseudomonadota bacterium]